MPGGVEPQILWLVHDPRAVFEADDPDRWPRLCGSESSPSILATRLSASEWRIVATDSGQIGIETHDEFARRIDPLPRDRAISRNRTGLSSNRPPETAGFHVGDESIVERVPPSCCGFAASAAFRPLSHLGEALVDCRAARLDSSLRSKWRR